MKLFPGKGLLTSVKGQCLDKGHLGIQEGHMKVEYLSHQKLFLTLLIQIKGTFFFSERALFNKVSDPRMLYLSKTGSVYGVQINCFCSTAIKCYSSASPNRKKNKKNHWSN